jgi:hypothetical protein
VGKSSLSHSKHSKKTSNISFALFGRVNLVDEADAALLIAAEKSLNYWIFSCGASCTNHLQWTFGASNKEAEHICHNALPF